ncbi:MAG: Nif3-like dinuclear metal center hexameric protein [Bacteroidetes bacterium]|nr:Nif3-like dinuclear metal center hexameric protein [Bacteroidota bacterium]
MKLSSIIAALEELAPPSFQENYDNSGLITGDPSLEIRAAVVSLDCTEAVVDEAIAHGADLIVAHHPIIFSGLKKITGKNYVERVIIKAIRNNIAIYAIHTNLDNVANGVNKKICEKLRLENLKILSPKKDLLKKLTTFCPSAVAEKVRIALWSAGGGVIGNYDSTSFSVEGVGTFRGNEESNPVIGEKGKLEREPEERIEMIFPSHLEKKILAALRLSHPYEEIAFDLVPLANRWNLVGSGMIGELKNEIALEKFLSEMKIKLKADVIRYTKIENKKVKKIAVCGGSGSFLIASAIAAGADVFVTADLKYHQFFDGEGKIVLADPGHFETEQYTIDHLTDFLKQKFPTFAVRQTGINTNPITYLT